MAKAANKTIALEQQKALLLKLEVRFKQHMNRHKEVSWDWVNTKLLQHKHALSSLYAMEETGGEPDVIAYNAATQVLAFCDCSKESPAKRRSLCYDKEALEDRKEFKPTNSAVELAKAMGVQLLTEEQYFYLQTLGSFDTKTSSWLQTPLDIRNLGGAIFGDCRYKRVFVYHNGASSYYAARGFRAIIEV